MKASVVDLVTPHLLRVVDLANQAEKGVTVDWHLRDAVSGMMRGLGDQYNASSLVVMHVEGHGVRRRLALWLQPRSLWHG